MKRLALISILFFYFTNKILAQNISVKEYLEQVKENYEGYKAAQQKASGLEQRRDEASMLFAPNFFAKAQYADDKRINPAAAIQIRETKVNEYSFGIAKQERFGLQSKFSYEIQGTQLIGIPPKAPVPFTKFTASGLALELNQPLWKNSFGKEFRIQEQQGMYAADAEKLGQQFTAKMILVAAEKAYWRLAVAQEAIYIQQETLDRTRKILNWQKKRREQNLSDEADFLGAKAALKGRQLDLNGAKNENRLALKSFNEFRGKNSEEPVKTEFPHDISALLESKVKARLAEREDVKAQTLLVNIKENQSELNREKYDPSFDIFAKAMLTGFDEKMAKSVKASFGKEEPLYAVGVSVSIPLRHSIIDKTRLGYLQEVEGEKLNLNQKRKDVDQEWSDLVQHLQDAKETLALVHEFEKVQKMRFVAEQERLSQGRTTTFQIFMAEEDYLKAQHSRLQASAQVLMILTAMKSHQDGAL